MKQKYYVSRTNQLVVSRGRNKLFPSGYFSLNSDNNLVYVVTEPVHWRRTNHIGRRIIFKGSWRLDEDHRLIFNIRRTNTDTGSEKLVLNAQLQQTEADTLVFSLDTSGRDGTHSLNLLKLRGSWRADEYNRLQFIVQRSKTIYDELTFSGIWQVNRNVLTYTYTQTLLKAAIRKSHTLRFDGYWEISAYNRLTYIFTAKDTSYFQFRAYLETPNLIEKQGVIKYRIGIGMEASPLYRESVIALYGVWKFHHRTGLSFELAYGGDVVKEIRFGIFVRIKEKNKVTLDLKSRTGKDLGMSLTLTRSFFKNNAECFLRLSRDFEHQGLEWGINFPW